jgi:hypothetical protein
MESINDDQVVDRDTRSKRFATENFKKGTNVK